MRSQLCEHYGSCPRCSVKALSMDTFTECKKSLLHHRIHHLLKPCVFGFPSNSLISLSKKNVLHLGEDHILEKSPLWVCTKCNAGFGSWPFSYALSCGGGCGGGGGSSGSIGGSRGKGTQAGKGRRSNSGSKV